MTKKARRARQRPKTTKAATWRVKSKAAKRHRKGMENRTMQTVALPKDLQGAQKLKWEPYAGRNLTYFLTVMHLRETYGKLYEKLLGCRFSYIFVEAHGVKWQMYRSPEESERLEEYVYNRVKNGGFVQQLLDHTEKTYNAYSKHAAQFRNKNFSTMDGPILADALQEECRAYLEMIACISCSIIFASALARQLKESLSEEVATKLALPIRKTLPLEEEIAFWKLCERLQKNGVHKIHSFQALHPDAQKAVQTHFDAYNWLEAYENDSPWTMKQFISRLNDALLKDCHKQWVTLEERHKQNEEQVNQLAQEHVVNATLLKQFRTAMYYRILGESLVGLANHSSAPLFSAIAKKLLLPRNQIKWFSDTELLTALEGKIEPETLLARLPERQKHYLVALGEKNVHVFEGQQVEAFLHELDIEKPKIADTNEVRGVSAYPGKVRGMARVVQHVGELDKVKNGDILVTLNTTPSFIMAMKRSAAIVTDEGGITCHAAIVSRELGIPCIISTKAGTKLIQDGSKVEVDAAKGTVIKLDG